MKIRKTYFISFFLTNRNKRWVVWTQYKSWVNSFTITRVHWTIMKECLIQNIDLKSQEVVTIAKAHLTKQYIKKISTRKWKGSFKHSK